MSDGGWNLLTSVRIAYLDLILEIHDHLHKMQYVYPGLADPVALPAQGTAWTFGALTEVIPINTVASDFSLNFISISAMSANASFHGEITYGAGDTKWCEFSITRSGVQVSSALLPVSGVAIPANSVVKARIADDIGTGTMDVKALYHLD